MASPRPPVPKKKRSIVDIHTHTYPPSYISLLLSRSQAPRLHPLPLPPNHKGPSPPPPRLIILPSDSSPLLPPSQHGRALDPAISNPAAKVRFMDRHGIGKSVISLANPWLDFLDSSSSDDEEGQAVGRVAQEVNDEMEHMCAGSSGGRIGGFFAVLPMGMKESGGVVKEVERLKRKCPHVKGVIMGTHGLGNGGIDEHRGEIDKVWRILEQEKWIIFLHPQYGLPAEVFGPRAQEYGHVLPLSLGFPLETTIAFFRMWLGGVFDRFPALKILLAHAGGGVPGLAGRVKSCVDHEYGANGREVLGERRRDLQEVLRENVWLDGVSYGTVGLRAAVECVGRERVMFGSDHPFFPPVSERNEEDQESSQGWEDGREGGKEEQVWESVSSNVEAVEKAFKGDEETIAMILGGNAKGLFGLDDVGKELDVA